MEVTGVVFRQSPCFSPATADSGQFHSFPATKKPNCVRTNRKLVGGCVVSNEFCDKSHLKYYYGPRMKVDEIEVKKKDVKKKMKLLKGLSKNLSSFSEMGFYLNPDDGLDQQVKGQMIMEATELLVGQLKKLKEEKMESKKIKKARKKASRMMADSSSSSSESSSSESDCHNVVNMSQLKTIETSTSTNKTLQTNQTDQTEQTEQTVQILEKPETRTAENETNKVVSVVNAESGKKIEVCMGGKCKKSGASMLLENFQAAVAGEVAVVGCKCMGKCRDGPNVMVRREEVDVGNALCIGVGLEDVDRIVNNFFGGSMVPVLSSS